MCKGLRKVLKEMRNRKIWGRGYNIMYNDHNVVICSSWDVADYCRDGYRDITNKIKEFECEYYFYNDRKKDLSFAGYYEVYYGYADTHTAY